MIDAPDDFRHNALAPVECFKEAWTMVQPRYWLVLGISVVALIIGSAFAIVLLGPMMCGVFLCLLQYQRGKAFEFGMIFKGFDYFLPSFIAQLIKSIPVFALMVPFYIAMMFVMFNNIRRHGDPGADVGISIFGLEIIFFLTLMVVHLIMEIFTMFAFPLIVERKLNGLDAIKLSLRAAKANLGGVIGFQLIDSALRVAGLLLCLVGFYFYLPISLAAYTIAYRRVFPDVGAVGEYPPPPPPGSWAA
jgi:uncharacterized membrane protein